MRLGEVEFGVDNLCPTVDALLCYDRLKISMSLRQITYFFLVEKFLSSLKLGLFFIYLKFGSKWVIGTAEDSFPQGTTTGHDRMFSKVPYLLSAKAETELV